MKIVNIAFDRLAVITSGFFLMLTVMISSAYADSFELGPVIYDETDPGVESDYGLNLWVRFSGTDKNGDGFLTQEELDSWYISGSDKFEYRPYNQLGSSKTITVSFDDNYQRNPKLLEIRMDLNSLNISHFSWVGFFCCPADWPGLVAINLSQFGIGWSLSVTPTSGRPYNPWSHTSSSIKKANFRARRVQSIISPPSRPTPSPQPIPSPANDEVAYKLLYEQIVALYDRGDYQGAIEEWNRYKKITNQLDLDNEEAGLRLAGDAIQLERFGQYASAIPRAKLATFLAPKRYEGWWILGILYVQQEQVDKGLETLQMALSLTTNADEIVRVREGLGMGYFQKGDYNAAIAEYETILKAKPNNEVALFALGQVYIKLRRFPEAIANLQKAANLFLQQGRTDDYQETLDLIRELERSLIRQL
ncbi:tetratricopeptide repeat protein [Microcystis aeruginosa BLCCF158]|uniref:Tetratricopeptide repeat protein n=1 Tax=Microcystis aeruginosa BLCC-F158 TaxID=2755316 RepID=A0A841VBB5_MICAE|nr:tetratricopeptide repeat protein [Microcystis aeruginosa]MBC1197476.1 tetratricopeptide repeat protein [Microcystis aeruginosa BLCC-F158]